MATETDIPDSVYSKKREGEDNELVSEFLGEKPTELPGNKEKQLESTPSQPLETSSYDAETGSTTLEAEIEGEKENYVTKGATEAIEGESFFQSPSVPKVATDETSSAPEGYEAATTQDQAERMIPTDEPHKEGKPKEDERIEVATSKEASADEHPPSGGDYMTESQNDVEEEVVASQNVAEAAHTERSLGIQKVSDMDTEEVKESSHKESTGHSLDTKTEYSEEDLDGRKCHDEGKQPESSETQEGIVGDTEEIKSSDQTDGKAKLQELLHSSITDACISTQTESQEEARKNEEKKLEEEETETVDGGKEKSDSPSVNTLCERTGSEKAGSEDQTLSDNSSTKLNEKTTAISSEDDVQEKEQDLNFLSEKDPGEDGIMKSQNAATQDMKETASSQHARTAINEEGPFGGPKEIFKGETEEKAIDEKGSPVEKREGGDNELVSEFLGEKPTELPGNKEKQLESTPSQPLETSSYDAETGSTTLEAEIEGEKEYYVTKGATEAIEGESFFQSPSVPKVATDETSSAPEGYEAATTQDQAERMIPTDEPHKEGKPKEDERIEVATSKEASADEHPPSGGDYMTESQNDVEEEVVASQNVAEAAHTERSLGIQKVSDMDTEEVKESSHKESTGHSLDTKTEYSEEDLDGRKYHDEGKQPESSETQEGIVGDTEEIKSSDQTDGKAKLQELLHSSITDACISTQTESQEEARKNEEKKLEEEETETVDGGKEKSDSPSVNTLCERTGSEKAGSEDQTLSDNSSTKLNEKTTAISSEDDVQEKEQDLNFLSEKDPGEDGIMKSQNAATQDMKETASSQHARTAINEEGPFGGPKEIFKGETEEKAIDEKGSPVKVSEEHETEANKDKGEQEPEESVNKPSSEIEQEVEEPEESVNKPSSEIEQEVEANKDKGEQEPEESVNKPSSEIEQEVEANFKEDETEPVKEEEEVKNSQVIGQDLDPTYHIKAAETGHVKDELKPVDNDTQDEGGPSEGIQPKESEDLSFSSKSSMPHKVTEDEILGSEPSVTANPGETNSKNIHEDDKIQSILSSETAQEHVEARETRNVGVNTTEKLEVDFKLDENQNSQIPKTAKTEANEVGDESEYAAQDETQNTSPDKDEATGEVPHSQISDEILKESSAPLLELSIHETTEAREAAEGTLQDVEGSSDKTSSVIATETEYEKLQKIGDQSTGQETNMQTGNATEEVDKEEDSPELKERSVDSSDLVPSGKINTNETVDCSETGELEHQEVEKILKIDASEDKCEGSKTEIPCITTKEDVEPVLSLEKERSSIASIEEGSNNVKHMNSEAIVEKTIMEGEKITEQDSRESESETNKEIEAKLEAEHQVDKTEDRSEMINEEVLTKEMPAELKQPNEKIIEEEICTKELQLPSDEEPKKSENEDKKVAIESLAEKVTELPFNKVKQLEPSPSQPLETSSYTGETEIKKLETDTVAGQENAVAESDIDTSEGETFLQSLSIPKAATDEISGIPGETTKIEDETDRKTTENEPLKKGEKDDEHNEVAPYEEASGHENPPGTGDHMKETQNLVEGEVIASKTIAEEAFAQTEGSTLSSLGLTKGSDMDTEAVNETCNEAESTGDSFNTKATSFEEDLQVTDYHREDKEHKCPQTQEGIEEDAEEIKLSEEIEEKVDQQGLLQASTNESEKEVIGNEEAIQIADVEKEKSGSPSENAACEKTGSEKAGSEEYGKLSDSSSINVNEKIIALSTEDAVQEKEQELNVLSEKDQGEDSLKESQDATSEDIKETGTSQHAAEDTTFEEQIQVSPEEILKGEIEDKAITVQDIDEKGNPLKASEEYENDGGNKEKGESKPEVSVNKPVLASSEIEQDVEGNFNENETDAVKNTGEVKNSEVALIDQDFDAKSQHTEAVVHMNDELEPEDYDTKDARGSSEGTQPKESEDLVCSSKPKQPEGIAEDEIVKSEPRDTGIREESCSKQIAEDDKIQSDISDLSSKKRDIEDTACETGPVDIHTIEGSTKEMEVSTLEPEPIEIKQNGGPDEPPTETSKALLETTAEETQQDISAVSSVEENLPVCQILMELGQGKSKAESEHVPTKALEFVSGLQGPEVVPESKDSKMNEEQLTLAAAEIAANNTSNETEETTDLEQATEHPSIVCLDAVLMEKEFGSSSGKEHMTEPDRSVVDPHKDLVADETINESCPQEKKEEDVKQAPTSNDEMKWSDTDTEAKATTEENLVSIEPHEELKPAMAGDQTNEPFSGMNKIKIDNGSISNMDQNLEFTEDDEKLPEDQREIEVKDRRKLPAEDIETQYGHEMVKDVIMTGEVVDNNKAEESTIIKDSSNEGGSSTKDQLTSATDENACQATNSNLDPTADPQSEGSIEVTEELKLAASNLDLKTETFAGTKDSDKDMKQDTAKTTNITTSEFEDSDKFATEEKTEKADAKDGNETLGEPDADEIGMAKSTSLDPMSESKEKDIEEVGSGEIRAHDTMHKLEEITTAVFETKSEGTEVVTGTENVTASLTEKLQEPSSGMVSEKHDPTTTNISENISDESTNKDETPVNPSLEENSATSAKEVTPLPKEKAGELQVSTLSSEIDEGKQNSSRDEMLKKEIESARPQELVSEIKSVDSPSKDQIREGEETQFGSQESSEENLKQQTKEAYENIKTEISSEKEPETTAIQKEVIKESPVISADEEENSRNLKGDKFKETEYPGEKTCEELEAEKDPFHTKELSDKVQKAGPTADTQEKTMANADFLDEEIKEITNAMEAPVKPDHEKKDDERNSKDTSKEAATSIEEVNNSETEFTRNDMDASGPTDKYGLTRNDDFQSANVKVPSLTDAVVEEPGLHPNNETTEEYEVQKKMVKEDLPLESSGKRSEMIEELSAKKQGTFSPSKETETAINKIDEGTESENHQNNVTDNQKQGEIKIPGKEGFIENEEQIRHEEPSDILLTKERSIEYDASVTHATDDTEDLQISQKYGTVDLTREADLSPEIQKKTPDEPCQNESRNSKPLTESIGVSQEQREPTTKSLDADSGSLKTENASGTEPQCSKVVSEEAEKMSDEHTQKKEKLETTESAQISLAGLMQESTKITSDLTENLIEERAPTQKKEDQHDIKEVTGDIEGINTDEEKEGEEDNHDNQKLDSCTDAPVMVEASKDMDAKVHKKSHNILSGVGSKVKHSIAKVKKAITGKSPHPKPPSPKQRDEAIN